MTVDDLFIADKREYAGKATTSPWRKPANKAAPVYAPKVSTIDVMKLIAIATARLGPNDPAIVKLRAVQKWLTDPSLHEAADVHVKDSTVTQQEIDEIIDAALLRQVQGQRKATVILRLTYEEKESEGRRRTVMHTHAGNDGAHIPHPNMMRVSSITTLRRMMRRNSFAASRDMKSWFHQLPMSDEVSEMYVVCAHGKSYVLTRAAMGHKATAAVAHTITKVIAMLAAKGEAEYDVIIDDVAFFAKDRGVLERVLSRFDALCAEINATVGSGQPPATTVTFRGITADLSRNTVRLRQSTAKRMVDRVDWYTKSPTPARAKSLLGAAFAAAQIVPIPVRTLMKRVAIYANTGVPADFAELAALCTAEVDNVPDAHDPIPFVGSIVADATLQSWGGVFVDAYGNVQARNGRFTDEQQRRFNSVAEAEALATIETAKMLPHRRIWSSVDIFTDSTVWLSAQKRSWARSDVMDRYREELMACLAQRRITTTAFWVRSCDNPADGISRMRSWSTLDTGKLCSLLAAPAAQYG